MRNLMLIMLLACVTFIQMNAAVSAKDEVTLTVSADGVSKDEAIKNALRSALEQTYGTFVSSNTTLLNDELVKDEIVSVSTGNIKKYKELISEMLPNGRVYVTLQATVSISKLVTFAKSKGESVEFDGASLYMNIQMEELNAKSQDAVLKNLAIQAKSLFDDGFDYSLEIEHIKESTIKQNPGIEINLEVTASPNKKFKQAMRLIHQTLKNLHVPLKQQVSSVKYKELKIAKAFWDYHLRILEYSTDYELRDSENLYNWIINMGKYLNSQVINFSIQDNAGSHCLKQSAKWSEKRLYGEYYRFGLAPEVAIATTGCDNDNIYILVIDPAERYRMNFEMYLKDRSELSKYKEFKIQKLEK